ncbi:MAG: transposase family protein [Anaerolineae bacterium]
MEAKLSYPEQKIDEEKLFTNTISKHFSILRDPRVKDNQKYPFRHLVIAIVCALICEANDIEAIVNYIDSKKEWFQEKLGMVSSPFTHLVELFSIEGQ